MVKCVIPQFHALKHVIGDLRAFLETTKHVCKLDKPRHIEVSVIITVDEAMFFRRRREFSATSLYQQQHNNKEQIPTNSNKFGFVSLQKYCSRTL